MPRHPAKRSTFFVKRNLLRYPSALGGVIAAIFEDYIFVRKHLVQPNEVFAIGVLVPLKFYEWDALCFSAAQDSNFLPLVLQYKNNYRLSSFEIDLSRENNWWRLVFLISLWSNVACWPLYKLAIIRVYLVGSLTLEWTIGLNNEIECHQNIQTKTVIFIFSLISFNKGTSSEALRPVFIDKLSGQAIPNKHESTRAKRQLHGHHARRGNRSSLLWSKYGRVSDPSPGDRFLSRWWLAIRSRWWVWNTSNLPRRHV